jgi:hypothetical protein
MSLSATPLTPNVDPNSLVLGDPASEVFEIQSGTATNKNDIDYNNQKVQNQIFTAWTTLVATKVTPYLFTDTGISPTFAVGAPIASATYADSTITVDVTGTLVGDDLRIRAWGTWQLNATSSPGDVVGKARIRVTEDVGGTPVSSSPIGEATIYDDAGNFAVPHNEPYVLDVRFRCTTPGTTRVTVQAKYEDLTGGAATGTMVFMFSARLDVDHYVRQ